MNLHQIFGCQTNHTNKQYCLVQEKEDGTNTMLLLPMEHLLTREDNRIIYFNRLADELIRHRRVQLFMFYPDQYLNIGSQEYQVTKREFIIPKSLLTPDYLSSKPHTFGKYAQTTSYENAEPTKVAPLREQLNLIHEIEQANK